MLITPTGEILTGGYDNRVKITSNTGTLIQQLTDMTSAVNVIALDADGRLLVGTAGGDFYRYNLERLHLRSDDTLFSSTNRLSQANGLCNLSCRYTIR